MNGSPLKVQAVGRALRLGPTRSLGMSYFCCGFETGRPEFEQGDGHGGLERSCFGCDVTSDWCEVKEQCCDQMHVLCRDLCEDVWRLFDVLFAGKAP